MKLRLLATTNTEYSKFIGTTVNLDISSNLKGIFIRLKFHTKNYVNLKMVKFHKVEDSNIVEIRTTKSNWVFEDLCRGEKK